MSHDTELAVARALEERREDLSVLVADALATNLPMIGLGSELADRRARHQERMRSTVQRFHQLVQLGVTADWSMVSHEYGWTARVLTQLGITWNHQQTLIDAYFQAALGLPWSDEERTILAQFATHLRELGVQAYAAERNAP